ncbi:MAG: NADH:quinone oxidoreductase subunit RnfC [Desulfovibrionaceae bacterium]
MTKTSFLLTTGISGTVQDGPTPGKVYVPLNGHSTKTVKKKALVVPGTCIAEHPDASVGDRHAPIAGAVADVTEQCIIIEPAPDAPADDPKAPVPPAPPAPIAVKGLDGDALRKALKALGVDLCAVPTDNTLVVNGMNPEPGVTVAEQMLTDGRDTLEAGLAVVRKLVPGVKVVLAVAEGNAATLSDTSVTHVKPVYPNSCDALVVAAATGKERAPGVGVMSVMQLYAIGRVAETGLPLIDTLVSVNGITYRVPIGTPVGDVLTHAKAEAATGDTIFANGPMRGEAVSSLDTGVHPGLFALGIVSAGSFPPVADHQCINCGECILACPARIRPNMITRYSEFKLFDKTKGEGIDACFECGLCGFYCTARRPMLQYIRLAKKVLAACAAKEA